MTHAHQTDDKTSDLKLAFWLNLGFTLLEIVGGLLINSVAILSDALHDLGDSFSLGIAWVLENYASRESDQHYSYGYRRFSLLGALINALILIGGSLFILSETIPRLLDPQPFDAPGMVILAAIGVAVNSFAVLRLRGDTSSNIEVIGWHLLEDVLGWAVVLVVGIVALFADLPILDPLLSLLITIYVLVNVVGKLRKAARLFLQAVPAETDLDALEAQLRDINGVQSTRHMHMWSLDGVHHVFSTHLVVRHDASRVDVQRIKKQIRAIIDDPHLEHVTIEIEYEDDMSG